MTEKGQKAKVRGLAIEAGMSRNKIKYTDEELMNGSNTLSGVTILKDHNATTDNSIGRVENQSYMNKKQLYEGWVEEDGTGIVQKIRDKRLKVSVGAMVKKLVREKEDDDFLVAKGIHYMELSTTPTPGIPTATIDTEEGTSDVVECFDNKQLQSTLTKKEINDIIENYNILSESDKNGGEATMADNEPIPPTDAPVDKPADAPTDKPADKPEDKPEDKPVDKSVDAPVDKPADAPEEDKDKPTGEKATNVKVSIEGLGDIKKVTEENTSLTKENQALKSKVEEMEKMIGATKGKVDNGKTTDTIEVTDSYAVETSRSGKISLFMMPNPDGSFPIQRGD